MKKRLLGLVVVLAMLIALPMMLTACNKKLTEAEEAVVGKYKLVSLSIDGETIPVANFEYFTMEFQENRRCTVKSKAVGGEAYEETARWKINDEGELEITTRVLFFTATEKYRMDESNNSFSGTNTETLEGVKVTYVVKMERIVE